MKKMELSNQGLVFIKDFIYMLETEEDLNPKTVKEYAGDIKHFITWYEGEQVYEETASFQVEDIATPTIIRYREAMQKKMKLKPATVNRRLLTLKRFFEWSLHKGLIRRDPSKPVKLVPEDKVSRRQMTDKEESSLIAIVGHYGSLRDQTMLILMLHTGLREMEVCNLTPEDVVIGKRSGHLLIRSGKRNKQRDIPLNVACRTVLEKYLKELPREAPYLFISEKTNSRLTERGIRYIVQKYMKLASLQGLSAHDLRHRFGYVMAENTPLHRLAQIMGHDSLNTTMIYIKATQADLQQEVEKIAWQ